MNFGVNLKTLRKKSNMSQEVLADKIGVTRQSVSKWEVGEAYPEMSNIVALCKIFHCQITDLINDNIIDTEKFDDKTKNEIILFKKNQQRRMKYVSKAIYIVSRLVNIAISIPAVILIMASIIFPLTTNSWSISENNLIILDQKIDFKIENNNIYIGKQIIKVDTTSNVEEFFKKHDKKFIIISVEYILISMAILSVLISHFLYLLYLLYKNISEDSTPFSLKNENIVNKGILIFIIYFILMKLTAVIFMLFTNLNLMVDFNLKDIITLLILISVVYLFKYGRMIQVDCQAKIYD